MISCRYNQGETSPNWSFNFYLNPSNYFLLVIARFNGLDYAFYLLNFPPFSIICVFGDNYSDSRTD